MNKIAQHIKDYGSTFFVISYLVILVIAATNEDSVSMWGACACVNIWLAAFWIICQFEDE